MTSISTDRVGGNLVPEGIHPFKVVEFEERDGPSGPYWNFTCAIEGNSPFAGQRCWVVVSLSPQARWKAEQWLDCFEIPEGMEIEGEDFINMTFRGKVVHNEGKDGKTRAQIDEFLPAQKVKLAKPAPAPVAAVKKAKPVVEEDDDEDEDDAGTAEDDGVAYDEEDEENEEEEQPAPKKKVAKPITPQASAGKLPKPKSKFKRPF